MSLVSKRDSVLFTHVKFYTNSPSPCNEEFYHPILLINPCQVGPTFITLNSFAPNALYLDHPETKILQHTEATDMVSTVKGDPTFCGEREYTFER